MKTLTLNLIVSIILLLSISSGSVNAQSPYKTSVGAMLYPATAVGPSFKAFFSDHVAFQTDLFFKGTVTGEFRSVEEGRKELYPIVYFAFETNVNIMYQNSIEESMLSWFIGGGVSMGYQMSGGNGKFGVNSIMGLELVFQKPFSIQIDFRPGYAMLYNANQDYVEIYGLKAEKNVWSHFDWVIGVTYKYVFKSKK